MRRLGSVESVDLHQQRPLRNAVKLSDPQPLRDGDFFRCRGNRQSAWNARCESQPSGAGRLVEQPSADKLRERARRWLVRSLCLCCKSRERGNGNECKGNLSAKCHWPILLAFYVRALWANVRVLLPKSRRTACNVAQVFQRGGINP